jgi:two-component system, LytTR family, sensor kinase
MSQKRTTISPIQKWKKVTTIVFVVLLLAIPFPLFGQSSEFGLELNEKKGLLSNVSRTTFVDQEGSIWVGTDAGLNCFPAENSVKQRICKRVEHAQIWGIAIHKNLIYIGSYDSGLYVFDLKHGHLLQRGSPKQYPRIRRIRSINNRIYVVHAKGVTEISDRSYTHILKNQFELSHPGDFPIDVFTIKNTLNICFYFNDSVFQRDANGKWKGRILIPTFRHADNPKWVICGKEINGKTYVGLFQNAYAVIHKDGKIDVYNFKPNYRKQMALWDVDGQGDDVYFSIGNNFNLNEGYFYKHKFLPNKGPEKYIPINELNIRKYGWSVYVDTFYKGVWFNTLTHGVIFKPHRDKWIDVPDEFNNFKFTPNYLICWNSETIQIAHLKNKVWRSFPSIEPLVDVCEYQDTLFLIQNNNFSKYHFSFREPQWILKDYYHHLEVFDSKLYLFRIFGMADRYDFKTGKRIMKFNPSFDRLVKYSFNDSIMVVQQEGKGYFLFQNDSLIPLKTNFISDKTKNHFFLLKNLFIRQIGNTLKISKINLKKSSLTRCYEINTQALFPETPIDWVLPSEQGQLIMGNNESAFSFDLNEHQYRYLGQFYIGQSPNISDKLQIAHNGLYCRIRNQLAYIPLTADNYINDKEGLRYSLQGNGVNFQTIAARSWEGQTISFQTKTPHYLFNQYGNLPIEIWNDRQRLEKKFIPIRKKYILENFPNGIYNFKILQPNGVRNVLFRINLSLFLNVGFWFILMIAIGLTGFILLQAQREKLLLRQKVVQLQLNTLKANLNPHFIFNIMNLIQSLIVRSEKNKALKASSELANLNRLFLTTTQKDLITLNEELKIINKYVKLEQMRYESDGYIDLELMIDPEVSTEDWELPPLVLQPIVENAIKHGHFNDQQHLIINIHIQHTQKDTLHINISNPIPAKFKRKTSGTQLGLSLVKERLSLVNDQTHLGYSTTMNVYENVNLVFIVAISLRKTDSLF